MNGVLDNDWWVEHSSERPKGAAWPRGAAAGGLVAVARLDGIHNVMMPFGVHVLHRPVDASKHDRHPDAALYQGPLVKQRFVAAELAHSAVETEIGFDTVLEVGRCRAVHVVDRTPQRGDGLSPVGGRPLIFEAGPLDVSPLKV